MHGAWLAALIWGRLQPDRDRLTHLPHGLSHHTLLRYKSVLSACMNHPSRTLVLPVSLLACYADTSTGHICPRWNAVGKQSPGFDAKVHSPKWRLKTDLFRLMTRSTGLNLLSCQTSPSPSKKFRSFAGGRGMISSQKAALCSA